MRMLLLALVFTFIPIFLPAPLAGQAFDTSLYNAMEYRSIGPYRGGRSCTVTGVPGKPDLYYFGATGGGVWRTKDAGNTWENISDGYFGGSIGAVAVSVSDPNVIYVGGGEKTVRGNVSHGYGIWKSEDAGDSWKFVGLPDSRHIPRIRIHPTDPNIVYAAVLGNLYKPSSERGVFKSVDGGASWEKVLFISDEVGAVDLCLDPNNPRIMYASTWRVKRRPWDLSSGGEGSGLWKSTDSGKTWQNLSNNKGLPTDTIGIIGLSVSPLNSNRVYAIIESQTGGVFRSDDAGKSWQKTNTSRALRQRAWYYTRIYADTQDPDIVYVMNVRYHKSKDGGKTFTAYNAPHGDHHDLWIAPEDNMRMIIADDGGAQVSKDGGENWTTYNNQPTAQFYRVTTDNHFPYRIYAAQQDNSTVRIAHRSPGSTIGTDDWEPTAGCECGQIAIDPLDQEIVYGGCYGGVIQRRNHTIRQSRTVNVWPDNPMGHGAEGMKYRFQWNFPIFFSPHNPNKLYTASNHLHVSLDEGNSWEIISPDLTRNDSSKLGPSGGPITKDNTSVEYYCTIFAAAESPRTEGVIWVGSDDGLIHLTRDGGENWTEVTPSGLPEWIMINSIEPDPWNDGGCYVAATMYKWGDFKPYLFKTKDYGNTWTKIIQGIDDEHFTRVIRSDLNQEGLLYTGTESGMYISHDDGANWQPFQLNLPIVPITDLAVKDNNLIVATQGRSLWLIDDLNPIYELAEASRSSVFLYQPKDVYRISGGQSNNHLLAGKNHPPGAMTYFYIADLDDSTHVSLTFKDSEGQEIKAYSNQNEKENKLEVEAGSNLFVWDLRYPDAEDFDGMIMWAGSLIGPQALPGQYQVTLKVGETEMTKTFNILRDPRSETPFEALVAQFDFVKDVNEKVTQAHKAIANIRKIKTQMKQITPILKENESAKELLEKSNSIQERLSEIEKTLYQTKNESRQDPLNFPIRLTNKLAYLNTISRGGEYPPTQQSMAVKNELSGQIDAQLGQLDKILSEDIPSFNADYKALGLDILKLENEDKNSKNVQ